MGPFRIVVSLTIVVCLITQAYGLLSVQYDVPTAFTQHTLKLCPCSIGESCDNTVIIPMMESSESTEWFPVFSSSFQSTASGALECEDQQLLLTINEGSFAFLATGELLHVHSKLILSNSSYCLKKTFSEDYVVYDGQKVQQVIIKAEICMTLPDVNLCCPPGSSVSKSPTPNADFNSTLLCAPSEAPALVLPISFDGSSHNWALEGQERDFPACHQTLSTVPINPHQSGFAYMQLIGGQLQLRWQPSGTQKYTSVDSSKYCIGQERSDNTMKPVAVVCHSEHVPENYCQENACFGKCCPEEQIFDLDLNRCVTSSFIFSWSPFREADAGHRVVTGMPSCDSYFALSTLDPNDSFRLLANGSLYIEPWSMEVTVPNYCFDIFQNQTHTVPMALVCFKDEWSKPHDNFEDQSTVLYFLSSVMIASAVHLIVALAFYLCIVTNERGKPISRDNESQGCAKLDIFQSLMCVFVCFSVFQTLLVSILQFAYQDLSQPVCTLIALAAELAALASAGYIGALWLQLCLRLQSPKVWQVALLCLVPAVLATLTVLLTALSMAVPEICDINAAFIDPRAAWPIPTSSAALLLAAFIGLSWPLCRRRYADTLKARSSRLCCLGSDSKEEDEKWTNPADDCIEEDNSGKHLLSELRLENNRRWLLLKLDCLLLITVLSPLLVWQPDAAAYWAFGDIVLTFKCNVVASCLWIYLCKHRKRT